MAPHTSNWDFYLGILASRAVGLDKVKFLGKKELFWFPLGSLMRFLGGYPVDRSAHLNQVDEVVRIFNSKEHFAIVLSPEGTRKKVEKFKTGFYHIARKAGVPLILVAFDYSKKVIFLEQPYYLGDNLEKEMEKIMTYYKDVTPKYPDKGIG